jgi:hypothetical protein
MARQCEARAAANLRRELHALGWPGESTQTV